MGLGRLTVRATAGAAAAAGGVISLISVLGAVSSRRRWDSGDDPTDGHPLDLPDHEVRTVVTADGTRLAVSVMGETAGPPIVLVHGFTGAKEAWATVARTLVTAGYHVVVYDLRGHGASTLGSDGTTLEALVGDLVGVLDAIDARHAVVVGHSMGGMTVLGLAVDHPGVIDARVGGLVLVSTEAAQAVPSGLPIGLGQWIVASGASSWALSNRFVGPILTRGSFGSTASLVTLDATRASWATTAPAVRAGFLEAMSHLDLIDGLATIAVPTVVVSGTRDRVTLPSHSQDIARLVPGAHLEVLPGIGHQVIFEAPEQLSVIIADLAGPPRPLRDGASP
jgi:non-heme chloroperoxidase